MPYGIAARGLIGLGPVTASVASDSPSASASASFSFSTTHRTMFGPRDPFTTPEPTTTHPDFLPHHVLSGQPFPNNDAYFGSPALSVSCPICQLALRSLLNLDLTTIYPTFSFFVYPPTRRCVWSTSSNVPSHTGILFLHPVQQLPYLDTPHQTRLSVVHIPLPPSTQHTTSLCHTATLDLPESRTSGRRNTLLVVAGASGSFVFPSPYPRECVFSTFLLLDLGLSHRPRCPHCNWHGRRRRRLTKSQGQQPLNQ